MRFPFNAQNWGFNPLNWGFNPLNWGFRPLKRGFRPLKKGFTLIEIVLVLVIAGIALSVTAVSLTRAYEKTIFKEEAKRVINALKTARNTAIMERAFVTFSAGHMEGTIVLEKSGSPVGRAIALRKGVILEESSSITFFPKGDSTGGTVKLAGAGERRYVIEVDPVSGSAVFRKQ